MEITQQQLDNIIKETTQKTTNLILKKQPPAFHLKTDNQQVEKSGIPQYIQEYFNIVCTSKAFGIDIKKAGEMVLNKHKTVGADMVVKALSENTGEDGSFLVFPEFSTQYIEMILPYTIMRNLPGIVNFNINSNQFIVPKETAGGAAYWGNEYLDSSVSASANKFEDIILSPKDLWAYLIYSQNLIDDQSLNVQSIVIKNIMKKLAIKEDFSLLNGLGSLYEPRGILTYMNPSNVITPHSALSAYTYSTVSYLLNTDLVGAENCLRNNDIFAPAVWLMRNDSFKTLQVMVTSTGDLQFPTMQQGNPYTIAGPKPQLLGHDVYVMSTTAIPGNDVYLVAPEFIYIADRAGLKVDVDIYQTGITVNAGQHLLTMHKRVDWNLVQKNALAYIHYQSL